MADPRPISVDLSLYRRFLMEWVKKAADEAKLLNPVKPEIVSAIEKKICEICDKKFVGASRYVIEELERILNWIDGAAKDFAEKKKDGEGFVLPLLVYGEPGVGKEIVATICHHVNQRTMVNTKCTLLNTNAADLDDTTWNDWAKAVSKTSGHEGTVFLDEFNTLAPRFANRLLKFLDKPHQISFKNNRITGKVKEECVRVLFIACSNKKPEELIASGFNEAVVMRLAAHYVEWPPLRKRPEDIALFVNRYLFDKRKKPLPDVQQPDVQQYERIDLNGLRLLCELPWPDNYRGLRGLLDDMLANRRRRHLSDKLISFEEVLECVRNRELLQIRVERGERLGGRSVVELVPRLRRE